MKKVKFCFWLFIVSFVFLLIFQNKFFFMNKVSLIIDFYFVKYETCLFPSILMFFFCFLAGLILSSFYFYSSRLKFEKMTKKMHDREVSLIELVSSLKDELEKSKIINDKNSNS